MTIKWGWKIETEWSNHAPTISLLPAGTTDLEAAHALRNVVDTLGRHRPLMRATLTREPLPDHAVSVDRARG